jgi:hypothetical protein
VSETDKGIAITSTAGAQTVIFNVPYTEADDHDETHLAYELLSAAAGK